MGVFGYDDVIHHILLVLRILCWGCYRISIVLALSCGRAKTIQICFVCTRISSSSSSSFLEAEKTIIKKFIRIPVDEALTLCDFFPQERQYCS